MGKLPGDVNPDVVNAATPNNSVLIYMTASPALYGPPKRLYLAGVPSGLIGTDSQASDQLQDYPNFTAPLGQYMAELTNNSKPQGTGNPAVQATWGYRARDKTNEVVASAQPVAPVAPNKLIGILTLVPLVNVGFGNGQKLEVYLSGWRRKNPREIGLAGAYRVVATLPSPPVAGQACTYFLAGTEPVDPNNFSQVGKIAPLTYMYPAYGTFWQVEKAVTRKRGESVARRRGRSPIRA